MIGESEILELPQVQFSHPKEMHFMKSKDTVEVSLYGSVISKVAVRILFSIGPTLKYLRIFCNESYNKKDILMSQNLSTPLHPSVKIRMILWGLDFLS